MTPSVSIAIPTRNRAQFLARTLDHLAKIEVPGGVSVELIIVDNGSSDDTVIVAQSAPVSWGETRVIQQPIAGASRARNTAIQESTSDLILFLDDDVRPSAEWLKKMLSAFEDPETMAVGGGIELDPQLCPDWMLPWHHVLFASTQYPELTGDAVRSANIGFRRGCFDDGVGFDPEIGAGTEYGFAEEYLFIRGLIENNCKVILDRDISVVHEFDVGRVSTESMLNMAKSSGRSGAYATYHFGGKYPKSLPIRARVLSYVAQMTEARVNLETPSLTRKQFALLQRASMFAQFEIEKLRPPNYDYPKRRKLRGVLY